METSVEGDRPLKPRASPSARLAAAPRLPRLLLGNLDFRLGFLGFAISPHKGVQSANSFPEFVHLQVRVDPHREVDVRVTGQGLGDFGHDSGSGQVGDEGLSERVEVGELPVELVRDAGGFQVVLEHDAGFLVLGPIARPEGSIRGTVFQPLSQELGRWTTKGDSGFLFVFGVASVQDDDRVFGVQVEIGGG